MEWRRITLVVSWIAVAVSYVTFDWHDAVSRVLPWRWDRPFLILMVLFGPIATFIVFGGVGAVGARIYASRMVMLGRRVERVPYWTGAVLGYAVYAAFMAVFALQMLAV